MNYLIVIKMKKFLTFLLLVAAAAMPAWSMTRGDVDGDGKVDVSDVNAAINIILELKVPGDYLGNADIEGNDNKVDVADVNAIINIILNGEPSESGITTYTINGVSFKMVAVEGGTFMMGATEEETDGWYSHVKPIHQVALSEFSIGATEVTQELWQAVMGSNPSGFNGIDSYGQDYGTNLQRPVECVSWNDCQEFIAKLNELTGKAFRLPTEAEWEYAARGGNKSLGYKYAGSNKVNQVAWTYDNSDFQTHAVGTKVPNELGLYDMSGNVYEWCNDWFGYYSVESQIDPLGPLSGSERVTRSSSWGDWTYDEIEGEEAYHKVWYRYYNEPDYKSWHLGLRLAISQ